MNEVGIVSNPLRRASFRIKLGRLKRTLKSNYKYKEELKDKLRELKGKKISCAREGKHKKISRVETEISQIDRDIGLINNLVGILEYNYVMFSKHLGITDSEIMESGYADTFYGIDRRIMPEAQEEQVVQQTPPERQESTPTHQNPPQSTNTNNAATPSSSTSSTAQNVNSLIINAQEAQTQIKERILTTLGMVSTKLHAVEQLKSNSPSINIDTEKYAQARDFVKHNINNPEYQEKLIIMDLGLQKINEELDAMLSMQQSGPTAQPTTKK